MDASTKMILAPGASETGMYVDCPGQGILDHMTSRWGSMLLISLSDCDMRFFELRDALSGISEKVLTQTLVALIRDGFIWRSADDSVPPKVSYGLTGLGREATSQVEALVAWLGKNANAIVENQQHFDDGQNRIDRSATAAAR